MLDACIEIKRVVAVQSSYVVTPTTEGQTKHQIQAILLRYIWSRWCFTILKLDTVAFVLYHYVP